MCLGHQDCLQQSHPAGALLSKQTGISRAEGDIGVLGDGSSLFLDKGAGSSKQPHAGDKKQDTTSLRGQQQAGSDCEQSIETQCRGLDGGALCFRGRETQ